MILVLILKYIIPKSEFHIKNNRQPTYLLVARYDAV